MNKRKTKIYTTFFLLCILVFLAYLNNVTENELSGTHSTIPVSNDGVEEDQTASNDLNPVLEYRLVDSKKDKEEGYIIEKYQEFEIFTKKDGTIYKTNPTNNFSYLKYKIQDNTKNK